MKRGRWWLVLSYALATLVAPGVHDHDQGAPDAFLESEADCDDNRLHVADHRVVDLGEGPSACPSCQLRGQESLLSLAPEPRPEPGVAIPAPPDDPSGLPGPIGRARCRAPPSA